MKCHECGQELPEPRNCVYAVRVRLGSGAMKWLYSEPTTEDEAKRNAAELSATGHKATWMTVHQAAEEKRGRLARRRSVS